MIIFAKETVPYKKHRLIKSPYNVASARGSARDNRNESQQCLRHNQLTYYCHSRKVIHAERVYLPETNKRYSIIRQLIVSDVTNQKLITSLIRKKGDTTQFLWVTIGPTYKLGKLRRLLSSGL
jgi:hypothetical protein